MNSLLVHAWPIRVLDDRNYLPYTHWIYLNEIVRYFDRVVLLSPVIQSDGDITAMTMLEVHEVVSVYRLPGHVSYIGSVRHFMKYFKAYVSLGSFTVTYVRYPVPFGWLQKVFNGSSTRIVHFVGDPIDAAINNPNFSTVRKVGLITLFLPEFMLHILGCRGARVFTNGHHLAKRIGKLGVRAIPLVSSTLVDNDFYYDSTKFPFEHSIRILYVGYLRKAKGIETVLRAFDMLKKCFIDAELTIVGTGDVEYEGHLRRMVLELGLSSVKFRGHVDRRDELNDLYRNHDVFCFGSLSEGSPRVILEAMANGLNVISTPVGSLPDAFRDRCEILFADFNNPVSFFERITELIDDRELAESIRRNAFEKVNDYRLSNFIAKIFNDT